MKTVFLFVFVIFSIPVFSQKPNQIVISGYIQDSTTGEYLIGASLFDSFSKRGATTNNFGFYSLIIPKENNLELIISYVGYETQQVKISGIENQTLNILLSPGKTLNEVIITGKKGSTTNDLTILSSINIPTKVIQKLPALGGETDIIKALQLMPGVQSGSEGSSNLFVRGGSPDQNLILLDDVPLYYVNHLGGFVSIFNTDAINNVKLIKGGFPARYGSRLSSIVDIRMKEGNKKAFHGNGMIGVIASKIAIEGPILQDSISYMVSARRMLLDLITKPISKLVFDGIGVGYHFYDFNAKINYKLSVKDHLYLSLYSGDDVFSFTKKSLENNKKQYAKTSNKWGNNLIALRWNHLFNDKIFSNLTLSYTRYRYLLENLYENQDDTLLSRSFNSFKSGIHDIGAKIDFEYFAGLNYQMRFGFNTTYHVFNPGATVFKEEENNVSRGDTLDGQNGNFFAFENAAYLENLFAFGKRWKTNLGLRISSYHPLHKNYYSFEPRLSVSFLVKDNFIINTSYVAMQQNVHLLTSPGMEMSMDLWLPATPKAIPEKSQQWTIGVKKSIANNTYELTTELYYKKIGNLITYKKGAGYVSSILNWEENIEVDGKGTSYGVEFLLRKNRGNTTGWLGYTYSKTYRQFDAINGGKSYPFKYDRNHDFSIVMLHQLRQNIDLSVSWVYGTGNAFTLALGHYDIIEQNNGNYPDWISSLKDEGAYSYEEIAIYGEKNNYRMRDYHRLDVGINFHKTKKWGERTWNISIYNLYNRKNPYFYFFENKDDNSGEIVLKQQSLFPFIPSVSYSFRF